MRVRVWRVLGFLFSIYEDGEDVGEVSVLFSRLVSNNDEHGEDEEEMIFHRFYFWSL